MKKKIFVCILSFFIYTAFTASTYATTVYFNLGHSTYWSTALTQLGSRACVRAYYWKATHYNVSPGYYYARAYTKYGYWRTKYIYVPNQSSYSTLFAN